MADMEARALEMGWRPQEEFKGDPTRWVDAETYVTRGESLAPLLKAQKEKLERDVARLSRELGEARDAIAGSQEAIKGLEEFYTTETKRQVEKARLDLRAQIKSARDSGDVDTELEAQEELTRLNAAEREAKEAPPPPKKADAPPPPTPEYLAWQAENPWFLEDSKKARRGFLIATELKEDNPTLSGKAFYDALDKLLVSEGVKEGRRTTPSKVEGGGDLGGERGERAGSFDDLPSDVKAVCDRQGKSLVGKDARFKTLADWRKYYVSIYSKEY
jgi:hypothetical protein